MKFFLFISFLAFLNNGISQSSLDSVLDKIDNKNLVIAPSLLYDRMGRPEKNTNKDNAKMNERFFFVETGAGSVEFLAYQYSKEAVSKKLYSLLGDSCKDFYADALLCDLYDKHKLFRMYTSSREQWIEKGWRKEDFEEWKNLLGNQIVTKF